MHRLSLISRRSVRPIVCSSVYRGQAMPFPSAANSVCRRRSLHGRKNMSARIMPSLKPLFTIWNVPRRFMRKKISSSIRKKRMSAGLRHAFAQNVLHLSSRSRNSSIRHAKKQTTLYVRQDEVPRRPFSRSRNSLMTMASRNVKKRFKQHGQD